MVHLQAQKQQAMALLKSNRLAEAKVAYSQLCAADPRDAEVWLMLGAVNGQLGSFQEAADCCQRALKVRPKWAAAQSNLGNALLALDRHEDAIASFRQALKQAPNDVLVHYNLANALTKVGRHEDALASYRRALKQQPKFAQAHNGLGLALERLQRPEEAERSYRDALRLQPGYTEARVHLGNALRAQGRLDEAIACYQHVVRAQPDFVEAYNNLGQALGDAGRYDEAMQVLQQALRIKPDYAEAYCNLGGMFLEKNKFKEAMACYKQAISHRPELAAAYANLAHVSHRLALMDEVEPNYLRALELDPGDSDVAANLGFFLVEEGRFAEAEERFEQAVKANRDNVMAAAGLVRIHEKKGDYETAVSHLRPLLDRGVESPEVAAAYGLVSEKIGETDTAIELMERVVGGDAGSPTGAELVHMTLGKLYDKRSEFDKAFEHYRSGNELKATCYEPERHLQDLEDIIFAFRADIFHSLPHATNNSELPIFIIGMPRSGTTLTEQIIASHRAVHGAGELRDMGLLCDAMPGMLGVEERYPQCLPSLNQNTVDVLAQRYLDRLQELGGSDVVRTTDKMPHNFTRLALIELLFPKAHVIHIKRDAMDNCLSIYFQRFNTRHSYATSMTSLGKYYRAYEKLMQHWKQMVNIPLLEIQYEELVADQERVTRQIIDFCGLDWDDGCLNFHESRRVVSTPSYDQVRQPMYAKSVQRWKHYEKYLDPLKEALGGYA